MNDLKLTIDLNVLNHLGLGLYSSTPSIVTEIVANAYDADASWVKIDIYPDQDRIVVEDDGHGMAREDVKKKFLNVGYSRRAGTNKDKSDKGTRKVMGRKGIGKLAMFSLADKITVVTRAQGKDATAFQFEVEELRLKIEAKQEYDIKEPQIPEDFKVTSGTRIILEKLNTGIGKTEKFLRPRLARRFSTMDDPNDKFEIQLNGKAITHEDRGYYNDVQFLWYFDDATLTRERTRAKKIAAVTRDVGGVVTKEVCIQKLENSFTLQKSGQVLSITGFIAAVDKPSKLGKDDESINQISIFANKRVFQTDILKEIGDARLFNRYIIGEIHADFLDADEIDRSTASRESVKHDDPEYAALSLHLKSCLGLIDDQWDEWRIALDPDPVEASTPIIEEWLNSLPDARDKKVAKNLIGSINKTDFINDEKKDRNIKLMLLQSAISGFEKLRVRRQLDKLENVSDIFSPEFLALFSTMDDIEASYYLDITKQRLEVIEKFKDLVDGAALEKVVQKYLFKHLWLLDPTWDRITGSEKMEQTMTEYLKKADPDTDEGARIDIAYLTSSARHVIVELKRPGIKVTFDKLRDQARKYIVSTLKYFEEHPDVLKLKGRVPPIDVYILVSEKPKPLLESDEIGLRINNIEFFTYSGLIVNAEKAYQEYYTAHEKVSSIDKFIGKIRDLEKPPS